MSPEPRNRFDRHRRILIVVFVLLILGSVELALRAASEFGLWERRTFRTHARPLFWDDIDPSFGVWRHPFAEFHHRRKCFDVVYRTNRFGARDRERSLAANGQKRFVVLGDSFVEGYGADRKDRMTDRLENATGDAFLNFGVSGNFGTIQEWLLYETLARGFEHEAVLLFLFPTNDFEDNDPEYAPETRFRPYLQKGADGAPHSYSVYYPVSFEERERVELGLIQIALHRVLNSVSAANLVYQSLAKSSRRTKYREGLSYETYQRHDFDVMTYSLDQIARLAAPRPLYLFTIPMQNEIRHSQGQGGSLRLVRDLAAYAGMRENVAYHDLLPDFVHHLENEGGDESDFFLSCDGHWSPLGNRVAAQAVSRVLGELPTRR